MRIGEGDVLITISFPRYSRRTVRAADYAVKSGAQVISITDSPSSPLAEHAHYTLLAHGDMASFVDSLVAPLSVINALILAVGLSRKQEVSNTFERLENLWDEYEVYEKPSDKNE